MQIPSKDIQTQNEKGVKKTKAMLQGCGSAALGH